MDLFKYIYANVCINCHQPRPQLTGGLCPQCFSLFDVRLSKKGELIYFIDYEEEKSYFLFQAKKFNKPYYVKKFSSYCSQQFALSHPENGVITFVPMHRNDIVLRGYNQSEIIAEEFGKSTKFKVRKLLKKIKLTENQKNLNSFQRKSNLEGAFCSVTKKIEYPLVYLVDDICTTGSTLNECKKTLLLAGVQKVILITLAFVKVK